MLKQAEKDPLRKQFSRQHSKAGHHSKYQLKRVTKTQNEAKSAVQTVQKSAAVSVSQAVKAKFKGSAVLISGAAGGLGLALIDQLMAGEVRALYLTARNSQILAALAVRAAQQGIECQTLSADLTCAEGQDQYLAFLREAAESGVEHFILTAGMAPVLDAGKDESMAELERTLTVNCTLQLKSLYLLMAAHSEGNGYSGRTERTIALISSQSALYPIPSLPVYGASKAALSYAVQALTDECAERGLKLTLIEPGFFSSPMGMRFVGRKWFVLTPEQVAGHILKAVAAGKRRAVFPWTLAFGIRLLYLLPRPVGRAVLKFFSFVTAEDAVRQGKH